VCKAIIAERRIVNDLFRLLRNMFFTSSDRWEENMNTSLRFVVLLALLGSLFLFSTMAEAAEKRDGVQAVARKSSGKPSVKKVAVTPKKKPRIVKTAKPNAAQSVADKLNLKSGAALVLEQDTRKALFQKKADQVMPIASLTKVMTAMVVLDGSPNLEAPIAITGEDIDHLRGSSSRLPVGSIISRETALLLALMSSENRAANALGRHYAGGMSAFLAAMNRKARALGMDNSHFEDPTGLSSRNVSTAYDLAKMVAAAHDYPLIRELTTNAESTINIDGRELHYRNTNPLVRNTGWQVGISKTGYISEAGRCLVMQAQLAEKPVLIVLLDSQGSETRVGDANRIKRWMETVQTANKQPMHTTNTQGGTRNQG
jgi:serine-type D-Ala-D-Ala endopeptidase (penicillin-binding protein 7)